MALQHQETTETETSEVIRLAQQMYERDRVEKERQTSLAAAAEEMGIPSEYLNKAAAQLKARRVVSPTQQVRRSPTMFVLAALISLAVFLLLGTFWLYARAEAPMAATLQPPAPIQIELPPTPTTSEPTPPLPPPPAPR